LAHARVSAEALRWEFVARQLDASPQLEWSPAVIGRCKAIEAEMAGRVLKPLARLAAGEDQVANPLGGWKARSD
jgi:hypothetical protein